MEPGDRDRGHTKGTAESGREVVVAPEAGSKCDGGQTAAAASQSLQRYCKPELAEIPVNRHTGRGVKHPRQMIGRAGNLPGQARQRPGARPALSTTRTWFARPARAAPAESPRDGEQAVGR